MARYLLIVADNRKNDKEQVTVRNPLISACRLAIAALGLALLSLPAFAATITLSAESAGFDSFPAPPPGFARLNVNGVDVLGGGSTRGVNMAVLDQNDGSLLATAAFDTSGFISESTALANFVASIAAGRIVLVGVQDDAAFSLQTSAVTAIASLGGSAANLNAAGFRGSYALIGVAGSGTGARAAFEGIATRFAAPVVVNDTLETVPVPASALLALLAAAGLVARRARA